VQIIPAIGVTAVYKEKDGTESRYPVVCWALEEETEFDFDGSVIVTTEVIGMILVEGAYYVARVTEFEIYEHFIGYEYADDIGAERRVVKGSERLKDRQKYDRLKAGRYPD